MGTKQAVQQTRHEFQPAKDVLSLIAHILRQQVPQSGYSQA